MIAEVVDEEAATAFSSGLTACQVESPFSTGSLAFVQAVAFFFLGTAISHFGAVSHVRAPFPPSPAGFGRRGLDTEDEGEALKVCVLVFLADPISSKSNDGLMTKASI